jgi:hypothetical protein
VALPDVTDRRQFRSLNAFRTDLEYAGWGLLSRSFAVGAMQYRLQQDSPMRPDLSVRAICGGGPDEQA